MLSAAVNQNKFAIAAFNSVLVRYISLDINKKLFYMKVEVFWWCSLKIVWVLRLMALPQHDNVEEANPVVKKRNMLEFWRVIFSDQMQKFGYIGFD